MLNDIKVGWYYSVKKSLFRSIIKQMSGTLHHEMDLHDRYFETDYLSCSHVEERCKLEENYVM